MEARAASHPELEGLLTEAGRLLASSLHLDETLRTVTRLAVPEFADWCAVDLVEPDGTLRTLSSGHPDPAKDDLLIALRARVRVLRAAETPSSAPPGGTDEVLATGEPRIYEPLDAARLPLEGDEEVRLWTELAPVSFLVVPLSAEDEVLGTITFLSTDLARHYDERDLPVAVELAERCAQAVRNAQAYEASESARTLLDVIFAEAPVGMAYVDRDLKYVLVNEQMALMNGRPAAAHVGRHPIDVLGEGARGAVELLENVIRTAEPVSGLELALEDEDRAFLASYAPIRGPDGVVGVLCAVAETTERHRAMRAVTQSEARFRALVDSGLVGVMRGRWEQILEANDAFLDMLGYGRADVEAGMLSWPDLTPERWRRLDEEKATELFRDGRFAPFEKEYLRRDGTRVPVLVGATTLPDAPGDWICFVLDLTDRKAGERERERLLDRTARLQAVTQQLSAALTAEEVADVILQAGTAATGATCGVLGLRSDDQALVVEHRIGISGTAPARLPLDAEAPMPVAAREGRPVLLRSRAEWLERFPDMPPRGDFEAFAAVPLLFEGSVPGVMGLGFETGGAFDDADVALLLAIARQGAQALERARLYEERAYVARTLQAGLLPRALPEIPGLETAVSYRPVAGGSEVGGDFYDLFAAADGGWLLAMGDVCGKGAQAAVLTGVVRSTVRALALRTESPAEILAGVNDALLLEDATATALATAACALVCPTETGFSVKLSGGGHPPALLLRDGAERPSVIEMGGRMLGVSGDAALRHVDVDLGPGDLLLLYTDGVLDARAGRGPTFGEERLHDALAAAAGQDAAGVVEAIDDAVRAYAPGPVRDDKALLALRVLRPHARA